MVSKRENTKISIPGNCKTYLEKSCSSTVWSTSAKTNLKALDRVQNQALRIITGAMKSTPIREMEKVTGIQPLCQRREGKILMLTEKYKLLPNEAETGRSDKEQTQKKQLRP